MARRPGTGLGPFRGQIGMGPRQRFRSDRPSPVCGGQAGMPRGKAALSSQAVWKALQDVARSRRVSGCRVRGLGPAVDGLPGRGAVLIESSAQTAVRLHVVAPVVQASGHAPPSRSVWRPLPSPALRGPPISRTEATPSTPLCWYHFVSLFYCIAVFRSLTHAHAWDTGI